jgi:hypothetical protein
METEVAEIAEDGCSQGMMMTMMMRHFAALQHEKRRKMIQGVISEHQVRGRSDERSACCLQRGQCLPGSLGTETLKTDHFTGVPTWLI